MKLARKLISLVLCLSLLLGIMPLSVLAEIGYPKGDYDGLILEFDSYNAMYEFREDNGGKELGGNMLLVDGTYSDAQRYDTMAHITSVTYNYTVEAASVADDYATAPNDPRFEEQTYPNSTAVWEGIAYVADTYEKVTLKTIRVGVIDSGIDATHDDLKNRVVAGYDAVNETAIAAGVNSDVALDSHGTKVAGLIAAESHNGIGIAGVSGKYPIQLVPLRALNENGNGKIADIIKAIYWAIDNKVDILNMSFGVRLSYYPAALANAIADANENGILMVAAAGNEGNKTFEDYYPACLDNVRVALAAESFDSDKKAHYSNDAPEKGNAYVGFKYTGVCGTDLLTTTTGNTYDTFTGTSASCAVVTGYYAMMLSLTGGRSNSNAYTELGYVFQRAMADGALFNHYNAKPDRLRSAIEEYLDESILFANEGEIRSVIECDSTIVGNTTVIARVYGGAHLVADATLLVYDPMYGDELYRSETIPNDGTNPDEYSFPLSVMGIKDGEVEIHIRYRTAEDVNNGYDPSEGSGLVYKTVNIKNSLIAKDATITLLDREGNEIYSNVYVIDLATNKLVHTIPWDESHTTFENKIPKSLFNGGKLAFAAYSEGLVYYIESEFKEEIVLGGDAAQMTTLRFEGMSTTLKDAKVYADTPVGMFHVGTTDENGVAEILMMEGDYNLIAVDDDERYIVAASIAQDGYTMEFSFAESIDSAVAYTLTAPSRLAANDYYSIGLSTVPADRMSQAATLGWIPASEPVIYVTPGMYYVQIGVFDTILNGGDISRYYHTIHNVGQKNLPFDDIDFDPTVLIASTPVAKYELEYGDKQYITFGLADDKGYAVYGGVDYYIGDEGAVSSAHKWEGYTNTVTLDADGNECWAVDVDEDWEAGTRDYFFATVGRWESLPAKNATYTTTIELTPYTFGSRESDMLNYTSQTTEIEFVVKTSKILRVSEPTAEGYDWMDIEKIQVMVDGKLTDVTLFGDEFDDEGKRILLFDARGLASGTELIVLAGGYNSELDAQVRFYSIVEYDPDATIAITPPEQVGRLTLHFDTDSIFSVKALIPFGDTYFEYDMMTDGYYMYPVGEYHLCGFGGLEVFDDDLGYHIKKFVAIDRTVEIAEGENEPVQLNSEGMESTKLCFNIRENFAASLGIVAADGKVVGTTLLQELWEGDAVEVWRELGSAEVQLSVAYGGERGNVPSLVVGYSGLLDFTQQEIDLAKIGGLERFDATATQATFTEEEDVTITLFAYTSDSIRLSEVFLAKAYSFMGEGYETQIDLSNIAERYYPTIRFHKIGEDWSEPVAMPNWMSANLGKLESGSYEVSIHFAGVPEYDIPTAVETCHFSVSGDVATHEVHLNAPAKASGEVKVAVRGVPGAVVTISYTNPAGTTKELSPIVLGASGIANVTVLLPDEGEYTFSAYSVVDGNKVNATPITVVCNFAIPDQVENFRATPEGSNALRLSWDVPEDADRVWLYRNGVAMGYVEAEYDSYLDKNLELGVIYTYSIIPVGANGRSGEATFTTGQPWLEQDTTAPTAPTALSAQVDKMTAVLSWTRSTDDVRVLYYYLYRDGEQIAMLLKRNYVDEGLTKNTTYNYTVTAVDAAGNESAPSPVATITTPANYELEVQVEMERGKTGAVTGEKLTINADAGRDANKVTAVIEYVSKDESGVLTTTIDLSKAGLYWRSDWKIQRVQEIKSIVVRSYEGETEIASKVVDGFPCLISSAFNFTLTIHNAPYAKKTLAGAKIILTDQRNGYQYALPVNTDSETVLYEFKGLSAGQYRVQLIWNNKILYTAKNLNVGTSAVTQHSADIDRFVRIKLSVDVLKYRFYTGYYDSILVEGQTLTEDDYLAVDGDSAFYIEDTLRVIHKESRPFVYDDSLYRMSQPYLTFAYTPGVYEFATPDISAYEKIESQVLYIWDDSDAWKKYQAYGETMLVYTTTAYGPVVAAFDDNVAKMVIPKMNNVTLRIEGKEFRTSDSIYSTNPMPDDKVADYYQTFHLSGEEEETLFIWPEVYVWRKVTFECKARLPGLEDHIYVGDPFDDEGYFVMKGYLYVDFNDYERNGYTYVRLNEPVSILVHPWKSMYFNYNTNMTDAPLPFIEGVHYYVSPNKVYYDNAVMGYGDTKITCMPEPVYLNEEWALRGTLQVESMDAFTWEVPIDWEKVTASVSDRYQTHQFNFNPIGAYELESYFASKGTKYAFVSLHNENEGVEIPSGVLLPVMNKDKGPYGYDYAYTEIPILGFNMHFDYDHAYQYLVYVYDPEDYSTPVDVLMLTEDGVIHLPREAMEKGYAIVAAPNIPGVIPEEGVNTLPFTYWDSRPVFRTYMNQHDFASGRMPTYTLESPAMKPLNIGLMTDRFGAYGDFVRVHVYYKLADGEYAYGGRNYRYPAFTDEVVLVPEHLVLNHYEINEILAAGDDYCLRIDANTYDGSVIDYQFDVQWYHVALQRTDGNYPVGDTGEMVALRELQASAMLYSRAPGPEGIKMSIPSGLPGDTATVYGYWYSATSTSVDPESALNLVGWPGMVSMELDINAPRPDDETIVLYCDEEPIVRHGSWELETSIDSVGLATNGDYFVKLRQMGDGSQNPCILALPEGAYGIEVNGVQWQEGTDIAFNTKNDPPWLDWVTTAVDANAITVSFYLPAAAMEADNTVRLYATNKMGTRFLQFTRVLEYDSFSISYNPVASTNEVHFVTPTPYIPNGTSASGWSPSGKDNYSDVTHTAPSGNGPYPYPDVAYRVDMFGLQGLYGETFGSTYTMTYADLAGSGSTGATAFEYIDKDMTWEEYALSNPRVGYDYIGLVDISAGKWIGFETGVNDFAIGIKVDDMPLIFTKPTGITMDIDCGKLGQGYDPEKDVYWINRATLAYLGMYRHVDGQGALFVPMAEPDSYPHTYDIDIDFCYLDSNGVRQYKEFHDEAITIYYNTPVLQKFEYEYLNGASGEKEMVTNGVQYNVITSYDERLAFEKKSDKFFINSGVFRFKAYFGEPDMTGFDPRELAHVYAAANVDEACANKHFELFWDEEEGCFVGVGLLGDNSFRPQGFGISYELAAAQTYEDMPTMQVNDLAANWVNVQDADAEKEGTVEYSAPTNGWSLEYTYEMWELYKELGADGELSEADIAALTDENGRLYYPLATFYDKDGNMTGTRQDYLDFATSMDADYSLQWALLDGADYLATVTQGVTVHDNNHATFVINSTDGSLLLPFVVSDDVSAAGVGAAIGAAGKAIAHAAKGAALTGKIYGAAALAAHPVAAWNAGMGVSLVSDIATVYGGYGFVDGLANDALDYMPSYLTPEQRAVYTGAKTLQITVSIACTAIGLVNPIAGLVLFGADLAFASLMDHYVYSGFRDLAEINGWDPNGVLNGMDPNTQIPPKVDPSGYVFEGYEENRLEGVTATLYFLEVGTNEWVKWNSLFYGEGPNPNITNSEGKYGWDVTYGKWKVVYEKDGYYLSESAVLDVPPPHLDVNIGMVSQNAATLKEVIPGKGGEYVDIVFDRPVLVEDAIAMLNVYFSGETVDGTISALNGGKTSNGIKLGESAPTIDADKNVACTFRFVPDEALEVGTFIHVEAKEGVETYNGMLCAAIVSDYVQIPAQGEEPITSIFYKGDIKTLEIGETLNLFGDLEVVGDLGDIVWTANNPEIATVDENGIVTAVSDGTAIFIATCGDLETAASVVVNPASHVCVYDQQVPNEKYLATEATEEAAATYYFSCTCGAIGTETFSHGEPLTHTHQYVNWAYDETHHWRVCSCGETATVDNAAHTWVDGVCEQCGAEQTKQELPIRFDGYSVSEDVNGLAFRFTIDVTGMTQKGTTAVYDNAKVMYNGQEYSLVGMGAIVSNDADAELTRENIDGVQTIDVFAKYLWSMDEDSASYAVRVIDIPENGKDTTVYARAYFVIEVEGEQVVVYADDVAEQTYNGVLNG